MQMIFKNFYLDVRYGDQWAKTIITSRSSGRGNRIGPVCQSVRLSVS